MAKSKIQKKKIQKKIKKLNKNEFGFLKTKDIKEYEGSQRGYYLESSPVLQKTIANDNVEEVFIVDNDKKQERKPTFNELSKTSITRLFQQDLNINEQQQQQQQQEEEDLGFFFDSTPNHEELKENNESIYIEEVFTSSEINKSLDTFKNKIIKDESVYIEGDDEDDDEMDGLSISSSEDIEIIKSLTHWGKQDGINQLEVDIFEKKRRKSIDMMDYHLLESICIDDIQRANHVDRKSNTILKEMTSHFIKNQDVQTYDFKNITSHGRNIVVPKIAKLFQLNIVSDNKNIQLQKTSYTSIPNSYKLYINRNKNINQRKKKLPPIRNEVKQVVIDPKPITSENIGHRMLSAMGWKEGTSIGKSGDGLKEPIKVSMRAKRRGLGA